MISNGIYPQTHLRCHIVIDHVALKNRLLEHVVTTARLVGLTEDGVNVAMSNSRAYKSYQA